MCCTRLSWHKISLLFLWIHQLLYQLRVMYNVLSTDKMKDDLKEIKREIQIISEKLQNQITSGEDVDLRTFAPIVSAHPYCARLRAQIHMPRHA